MASEIFKMIRYKIFEAEICFSFTSLEYESSLYFDDLQVQLD